MSSKQENTTVRTGISISKELLNRADEAMKKTEARSRSDFIAEALEFYMAWLHSEETSKVLTPALESVISGRIGDTENRIARVLFKQSVELAMLMHVVAATHRYSDSKEWWSDYYKLARKYLYGNKDEKPDFQKAMPLLLLEANRGNGYACYDLGRMHLLGQGYEENEEEAQRWFRDALEAFRTAETAAEKEAYLRYRIGKCHAYGHGTVQNYEKSARWFRQAVDENNPFAAYSLGGQYLRGQGVEQSDAEAYSLFYMAATHEKQPNAYAQFQLGKMHRDGIGTEANLDESRLWYARAYTGFLAMEETMADDRLYYRLGSMNMTGTGTEVDLEKARYYFEKAAELDNADALYGLGKLYLKPEFSGYDPAKAVEYLEESAAKGNAFAKYQLGKLLCQGELVPKDIARGLPLLEELAENGVTLASYIAGKVYLKEEGWQNIKKAILTSNRRQRMAILLRNISWVGSTISETESVRTGRRGWNT